MVLVGSASFNMLVVTGVSILAAWEVKKIEAFGAFVVTAIFSCFAYVWFFVVLCVSTPGFIDFWEAVITLSLYFILILFVYVTEKVSWSGKEHNDLEDEDNNRVRICRHTLIQLAH